MKNKRFIITIVICIALVITFVLLNSYAYWRVQKTQTGTNDILGACLDIELEEALDSNNNPIEGFTLENAWPISYMDAYDLKGYNFKVINKCPEEVIYDVILDSLPVSSGKEMNSNYVYVALEHNNNVSFNLNGKYGNYDEAEIENTGYEKLDSRRIYTGVAPAATDSKNGEVEHNIKIWISDDSPNNEIGKEFSSKVRVVADQNVNNYITPEGCFNIDLETGTIIDYDEEECSKQYLVVPETINGVTVKSIDPYNDEIWVVDKFYDQFDYIDLSKATGLETIGFNAFVGFTGRKLIIGEGLKTIGVSAFQNYYGPEDLKIPEGVETIGGAAFENFGVGGGQIYTVYLPSTIRYIDSLAFWRASRIVINMSEEEFNNNVLISYPWITRDVIFTQ